MKVLKKYCDLKEEYYSIIALWIIGTYIHNQFPTYPFLFFNAMKGSGKTRLLKLISHLSYNGTILVSMSEAVLFRTASNSTICIDEFENIGNKEKAALRELLNAAYKKGLKVKRAYKTKGKFREKMQVEEFDVYCPIALANIWGMESVLSDRCISLVLERSNNRNITLLMELFENDEDVKEAKLALVSVGSAGCNSVGSNLERTHNVYVGWNDYIYKQQTLQTLLTLQSKQEQPTFYEKIVSSNLEGRYLELFFALFILAEQCNVLDYLVEISKKIIESKKEDDTLENNDVSLLKFLAELQDNIEIGKEGEFVGINEETWLQIRRLTNLFKELTEWDWISSEWIGRSLKRLDLVIEKKRKGKGREVRINFKKAKEKIKMFQRS
jgi:hypothetical protein